MSGRASGSWVEVVERTFAFRPPQPETKGLFLFGSLCSTIAIFGSVFSFAYADTAAQRWFWIALASNMSLAFLINVAEASYAGAFRGKLVERSRKLRAGAYVAVPPTGIHFCAAMGCTFAEMSDGPLTGTSGALLGGAAGIILLPALMLLDLRRGRVRAGGFDGSERR